MPFRKIDIEAVETTETSIDDPIIITNKSAVESNVDVGILSKINSTSYTGLIRDNLQEEYYLLDTFSMGDNTRDIDPTTMGLAKLNTSTITASNVNVNNTITLNSNSSITGAFGSDIKMSSNVDMGNNVIVNVATPTLPHHATNKEYVDTKIAESGAGNATFTEGWRDLTSDIIIRGNQSSAPTWEQIGTLSDIYGYNFAIDKECWAYFHMDHDYKPGGDVLLHVHWTTTGTSTNTVKWEIKYTVAKGHNQSVGGNFASPTTVYVEQAASGTAYRHMVTEMSTSISVDKMEPDSLLLVHFKRVSNGGTNNPDNVFGLTLDCHYQTDRNATINRAPNFYA